MEDNDKNKWGKGWAILISEFFENLNQMMAMKIKAKIREEKIMLEKKIMGIVMFLLGMLIFFIGLAVLIGALIGAEWAGWLIVGGALAIISLLLFKS